MVKRLGGEVRAKRLRKRFSLSPARCALAASSVFAMVFASAVYVASIPGFTPPSTYKLPQADGGRASSFAAVDIAKEFAGSRQGVDQPESADGSLEGQAGEGQSAGLLSSLAVAARSTVQQATSDASSASQEGSASAGDAGSSSSQQGGDASSSGSSDSGGPNNPGDASNADSSSNANGTNSSLSPAEEAEFHSFLVSQFNTLGNAIADQGELAGMLENCVNTGSYASASAGYSNAVTCDGTIDSVKASLNRQVAVAGKSRYYRAWEELELCCNDLGSGSVSLLQGWRLASSSDAASYSSQMLSCASQARSSASGAYAHQSSARGLL